MLKRLALVLFALLVASCGGSSLGPSQMVAQVAGTWNVQTSIVGVSGDQTAAICVLANLHTLVPAATGTAQIAQSGANLNATTQDITPNGAAVATYTGTAGANTVVLNYQACDLCAAHGVACSVGTVDIAPQQGTITANLTGSTLTGSKSITYKVGGVSGPAMVSMSFTATKQ